MSTASEPEYDEPTAVVSQRLDRIDEMVAILERRTTNPFISYGAAKMLLKSNIETIEHYANGQLRKRRNISR